jgi:hypothetical protein
MIWTEATGTWRYSPSRGCGPDGDLNALVGDGVVRVAGSYAVVQLDDQASGPIFLTINDELTGLSDNDGQLQVKLSITQLQGAT